MPKNIRRHMHVNCECSQIKNLNKLRAIHKQRDNFSGFFKPPSHVGSFLVLSFGNFDQFLTPPHCQRRLRAAPYWISNSQKH